MPYAPSINTLAAARLGKTGLKAKTTTAAPSAKASTDTSLDGSSRLHTLLSRLEKLMAEKYAFDVFAKDSIDFGILVTYRQTWEPVNYQVGDLVSTIPLAPKEVRRYTTRTVVKRTRAQKELEDNLQTRRNESSD